MPADEDAADEKEMPAEEPSAPAAKEEPSDEPPAPAPKPEPEEKPMPEEKPAPEEQAAGEEGDGKVMLGTDELFAGIPGSGELKAEEIEAWLADDKNHEPLDFVLPMGMAKGATQVKGVDKKIRSPGPRSNWAASFTSTRGCRPTKRSVARPATTRTKALPGTRSSASASRGRPAAATRRSATTAS